MPIPVPSRQLSTLCVDFITGLPESKNGNNAVLLSTDQLTKWIKVIPGKDTWSGEDWARAYYENGYEEMGLPENLISDRDPKFTSAYWRELCSITNTRLSFTTSYHAKANGQSERSNQTFIHAMRCAINGRFDQSGWEDLIPAVTFALNTSPNTSTGFPPYELRYGQKPRSILQPEQASTTTLTEKGAKHFVEEHRSLLKEAHAAIALAQARMKAIYDEKRKPVEIHVEDEVYLKLAKGVDNGYKLLDNFTKFSFNKMGPYKVAKVISPLSFELELPSWLSIHPVISIEHLEPKNADPYKRKHPEPGPILVDGEEKYIIEEITDKEMRSVPGQRRRQAFYQVRYMGYDAKEWRMGSELRVDVPALVEKFERDLLTGRRRR
jgi:hypothetical protein